MFESFKVPKWDTFHKHLQLLTKRCVQKCDFPKYLPEREKTLGQILSGSLSTFEVWGKMGRYFAALTWCVREIFNEARQLDKRETLAYLEMKVFKPGHAKFIGDITSKTCLFSFENSLL